MTTLNERIANIEEAANAPAVIKRPGQDIRRRFYQIWRAIERARMLLNEQRWIEKKARRLDTLTDLREASYHLTKALAYLNHASKRLFSKNLEDLEAYK